MLAKLKLLPIYSELPLEKFLDIALVQLTITSEALFKRKDLVFQLTELIETNLNTLITEIKDEYLKIRLMFLFGSISDSLFGKLEKAKELKIMVNYLSENLLYSNSSAVIFNILHFE
jgi:hypothetical protein